MPKPTEVQRRVLEFVRSELLEGKPSPTLRELTTAFGWRSKRAAGRHVENLLTQGWLLSEPGKHRSLRLPESTPVARTVTLPLLGSISAGFGEERESESGECISVSVESIGFKPSRNSFALRVSGDSMIGRHICDGDIVVFEHGPDPRPGQIVAALIDRKNTLKTFVMHRGKPFLKAENPKYPDLIPSEELVIQGVFRALIRRAQE